MNDEQIRVRYESTVPFDPRRIRAAAVYCSDGRLGSQFDDFMQTALQLPRYDRLAIPGGAACLASHFAAYREEEGVAEQLRFLVRVHGLQRVVLIAHEDCAFYTQRLNVSALQMESQQRDDLHRALRRVRQLDRDLEVSAVLRGKPDPVGFSLKPSIRNAARAAVFAGYRASRKPLNCHRASGGKKLR